MKLLFIIFLSLGISIKTYSQAQIMFKNFRYEYNTIEIENQSYIDTVTFKFKLRKKYKDKSQEVSRIVLDYGSISGTQYKQIRTQLINHNKSKEFQFEPMGKRGKVIILKNKKIIYKIPLRELRIEEINYAFFSADYHFVYYKRYLQKEGVYFYRERLFYGSITEDEYHDRKFYIWRNIPKEKRDEENFWNIENY